MDYKPFSNMSSITLEYDCNKVNGLNTEKVMVAVPLVYMFMVSICAFSLTISSKFFDGPRASKR